MILLIRPVVKAARSSIAALLLQVLLLVLVLLGEELRLLCLVVLQLLHQS